jgi:hypothetical protein
MGGEGVAQGVSVPKGGAQSVACIVVPGPVD